MKRIIPFVLALFIYSASQSQNSNLTFGVTLCGAEFGDNNLPGTLNVNYVYPQAQEVSYFASKGSQIIQLPFRWERVQKKLGGPLDPTEVAMITKFVDECASRNIKVTLVMQNFGRYKINNVEHVVGGPVATSSYFRDFWKKMAMAMMNKYNVFAFSIMSEPHDMKPYSWFDAAQQAIYGIRSVDRETTILVDGDNYSGPETWAKYNDDLKFLVDPANRLMFNAHCYFDDDRSGQYKKSYDQSGVDEMTGVKRMKPFLDWLKRNNLKGFVGEFGVPKNDQRWLRVLDNFLKYLTDNGIGGCYWAAGPWWKNYPLSIEPNGNADQPQLVLYSKYLQISYEANAKSANQQSVATLR